MDPVVKALVVSKHFKMNGTFNKYSSREIVKEDVGKKSLIVTHNNGIVRKIRDSEDISQEIEQQLNGEVDDKNNIKNSKLNGSSKIVNQSRSIKLPDFTPRNSLITDLGSDKNCRSIFHIFIAIFIMLLLSTFLTDYLSDGKINLGLNPMRLGFGKFWMTGFIWGCMQLSSFGLYFAYKLWAEKRSRMSTRLWDRMWLIGFIVYQFSLCGLTCYSTVKYQIPAACTFAILIEVVRFLMKNHAFVRTNAPRILEKGKDNNEKLNYSPTIPKFSSYVYFLFAPTLLYRDSYPRSMETEWKLVLHYSIQFICIVWFYSLLLEQFAGPQYRQIGLVPIDRKQLIRSIFISIFPGILIMILTFYVVLHVWMNAASELIRFADRQFYLDWWTSPSYEQHYRRWNIIVQNWLYEFVYKDLYEIVWPGNKIVAGLSVFILSGLFHELILSVSFGFFYPVKLMMFNTFGIASSYLIRPKKHQAIGNCFILSTFCIGMGLEFSLYTMEYYARINCPIKGESWTEYFVPVSWTCNGIVE